MNVPVGIGVGGARPAGAVRGDRGDVGGPDGSPAGVGGAGSDIVPLYNVGRECMRYMQQWKLILMTRQRVDSCQSSRSSLALMSNRIIHMIYTNEDEWAE